MSIWTKNKPRLTTLLSISAAAFGLAIGLVIYLIWNLGTYLVIGIPLQLLLATIGLPLLLFSILIWLAARLDQLSEYDDE